MLDNKSAYNIQINVETNYLANQSSPDNDKYVFSYTISIENQGARTAQLISRHWIITNANGDVVEVEGDGVVGQQPHLKPGEEYTYTSGAILETPIGTMEGSYLMQGEYGYQFKVQIPVFSLVQPGSLH